jgi:hypothetical protein
VNRSFLSSVLKAGVGVIDLNFHRCGCLVFGDVHDGLNGATGWLSHPTKSEYLWVAAFRRIDDGITTTILKLEK